MISGSAGPARRILVVEDDAGVARAMLQALAGSGYCAGHAADGAAALRWLQAEGRPDLMLVDLAMPVMDGASLIERLRGDPCWATVPVIVTAAVELADLPPPGSYLALLRKPFGLQDLLAAVASALDG